MIRALVFDFAGGRRDAPKGGPIAALDVMAGVREYAGDAKCLGLRLAVASCSSRAWVLGHLARLGLRESVAFEDSTLAGTPLERLLAVLSAL